MRILIFGVTGSIGMQSIEVIKNIKNLKLVGFSFNFQIDKAKDLLKMFPDSKVFSPSEKEINNVESFEDLIIKSNPDIIINAISGFCGLEISLLSIRNNITLALANKESLVVAGKFLINESKKKNVSIIPIDSEITSIFSIYKNNKNVKKIIITASGGKYFGKDITKINNIDFKDVIDHPKWVMGEKISIDSSTMINKYFEMISFTYLFNCEIDALQHPEAIIHSIIEYFDGSIQMYGSNPDMKLSIQNVLCNFDTKENLIGNLNFDNLNLSFNKIDENKWPPIKWAKDFFNNRNLSIPVIVNAANDALFELFKNKKINFKDIIIEIQKEIDIFFKYEINSIDDVFNLNNLVRKNIMERNNE